MMFPTYDGCSKRCSKNICDFFLKQIRLSVQTRRGDFNPFSGRARGCGRLYGIEAGCNMSYIELQNSKCTRTRSPLIPLIPFSCNLALASLAAWSQWFASRWTRGKKTSPRLRFGWNQGLLVGVVGRVIWGGWRSARRKGSYHTNIINMVQGIFGKTVRTPAGWRKGVVHSGDPERFTLYSPPDRRYTKKNITQWF